jgi:hypothetical protein
MIGQVAPGLTTCATRRNVTHSSRNASSRLKEMINAGGGLDKLGEQRKCCWLLIEWKVTKEHCTIAVLAVQVILALLG